MLELIKQPWHWSVAGVIIGLGVPILYLIGNKPFGISSSFRHLCAACLPSKVPYFQYDWKKETWNIFLILGIVLGAGLAATFLSNGEPIQIAEATKTQLSALNVTDYQGLVPTDIFNFDSVLTPRGFIMIVVGGFLVGFGTRYAGGCTSGHAITGISNFQVSSIVATICFMAGGFIMTHLLLPFILKL